MRIRINRSKIPLTLIHGASATTVNTAAAGATTGIPLNGILSGAVIVGPAAVDSTATVTVSLIDQDGNTAWSKAGLAAASTTQVLLTANATAGTNQAVPLSGNYQVKVVYSAAQTATDSTTSTTLLIDTGSN